MQRIEVLLFVLGISALAYFYGVASTKKQWFPTNVVEDGWRAAKALKEVWDSEARGLPLGALDWVHEEQLHQRTPYAAPTQASTPPDDLILITGGPYKLMEFCPELGCLAWLMDRRGAVYYAWPIDPTIEWGETLSGPVQPESINPVGAHVYDNGDLLMTLQGRNSFPFGVGVAKVDRKGKLLWKNQINAHHWFDIDDNGLIYAVAHRLLDSPLELGNTDHRLVCEDEKIYEDFVVILDPDGQVIEEFSLLDVYIGSGYAGLLERTREECNPLHLNDVRVLKAKDAAAYPDFTVGDLLVSTKALNTVAILDRDSRRIKWLVSGATIAQHSPRFAGDNRILVFDNWGGRRIEGKGGSRIIEIDARTQRTRTVFPKPTSSPSLDFYTTIAGHFDLDRTRSRALVSLSLQGRVMEIDLETGRILWEYADFHDIGDDLQAEGADAPPHYAQFIVNSAYYAGWPDFLEVAATYARPLALNIRKRI